MKITFLVNSLGNSGGMERVLSTKANYLAEQANYEITILVKYSITHDLFFKFSSKIKIISLNIKNHNRIIHFTNIIYEKRVLRYLISNRQNFVIGFFGDELNFLYRIKDGSIKIQEFHFSKNYLIHLVNYSRRLKFIFLHKIKVIFIQNKQEFYSKKYNAVVLLTHKDKELWRQHGVEKNTIVIPNPVSFRINEKSKQETKKFIAIGRLTVQKGFYDLIMAFSMAHQHILDWTLDIYGEGQDFVFLKTTIDNNNLQDKIKILTPEVNIEKHLVQASVFLFPSIYEGFGLVLTEAMECGLPIIAYDCECGPSEIIKDGEDGFLVPVGDIEILSKRMVELAKNQDLRKHFATNAVNNVNRFYTENIMKEWLEFFSIKR
jgi:glycosyltransferase involved in cell wall biosynthesis